MSRWTDIPDTAMKIHWHDDCPVGSWSWEHVVFTMGGGRKIYESRKPSGKGATTSIHCECGAKMVDWLEGLSIVFGVTVFECPKPKCGEAMNHMPP